MSSHDAKILRIAEAYGLKKKWGVVSAVAERMGSAPGVVSGWKARGVPNDVLVRVAGETGYMFEYLNTGRGPKTINSANPERAMFSRKSSGHSKTNEENTRYGFERESMREAIISIDMVEKSIVELIPSEIKAQLTLNLYDMYVRKEKVSNAKVIQLVREALAA